MTRRQRVAAWTVLPAAVAFLMLVVVASDRSGCDGYVSRPPKIH